MNSGSEDKKQSFFDEVKVFSELVLLKSTSASASIAILGSLMAGLYDPLVLALLFLVFWTLMGVFFILDSIRDIKEDMIYNPDRPIPSGRIDESQAARLAVVLLAISLLLIIALYFVRPVLDVLVFEAFALVAVTIYFVPPALKRIPMVSNVIFTSLNIFFPILAGWSLLKPPTSAPFLIIGSLFFLALGDVEDLRDVEGDRFVGMRTLPVLIGVESAAFFFSIITLLSAMIGVIDLLLNGRLYWLVALPQQLAIFYLTFGLSRGAGKQDVSRVHSICKFLSVLTGLTLIIGYLLFG